MNKPAWQSWTIALNGLTLLTLALTLPEVNAIVPAAALPYIAAFNAVANLLLRYFKTTEGLR